ncbi:hypothetical protein ACFL6T_00430 [Candidatus Zixiibacteriota bacterium]
METRSNTDRDRERSMELSDVILRPLRTHEDFDQCVALQRETWGEDFTELVPPSILMVSQKVGGVAVGAFDTNDRLLGFVFGVTGIDEGEMVHWSDMLAVRPEHTGRGLGRNLKAFQRDSLLKLGVETVRWSCDPLEASNAHLNINRLGALPVEYVEDMYGANTTSTRHAGIGTDRFVIEWSLTDPRVERALEGRLAISPALIVQVPVVNSDTVDETPGPVEIDLPELPSVRIEIPADIQKTKEDDPDLAGQWRLTTRRAFLCYLGRGYLVDGFINDPNSGRCFYFLTNITSGDG